MNYLKSLLHEIREETEHFKNTPQPGILDVFIKTSSTIYYYDGIEDVYINEIKKLTL